MLGSRTNLLDGTMLVALGMSVLRHLKLLPSYQLISPWGPDGTRRRQRLGRSVVKSTIFVEGSDVRSLFSRTTNEG